MCCNEVLTFGVGLIKLSFHECTDVSTVEELSLFCRLIENGEPTEHAIVFTQYMHSRMFSSKCYYIHFSQIVPRVCTLVLFILFVS